MKTKEEKLEYNKQYRLNNKEKIKQYRIANKEKIRQSRILYDEKNKEKIREQQRLYKEMNADKISEYQKQYISKNKEKIKQYPSNNFESRKAIYGKYHANNKSKMKEYKLMKMYGITTEQYNELYNKQKGNCAICGTHESKLSKKLCVDHNHMNNNVRGLLCDKCNRGLGHFNDNIETLQNAISYLKDNV